MSTSPPFSAARRVDSSGIERKTRRLTLGVLRQYPSIRLHHELDARGERDKFVRPCPDRVLLETIVADLLDIFLRHDPARAAGVRIKGQKVRPRFLQLEADMPLVRDLHRRDPLFQQGVGGALVALERELDVLGGHRIAAMELGPRPDHEIIGEAVLRRRERLGQARRRHIARHRFHHAVMQRVQHHEGRDDAGGFSRIEPGRRERYMDRPGQLALRPAGEGQSRRRRQQQRPMQHPQECRGA